MRGSLLVLSALVFVLCIAVFSRLYATFMQYVNTPTPEGLLNIFVLFAALVLVMTVLGFIMYATERRMGNVKVKNALFERLLGYAPNAVLPKAVLPEAGQNKKLVAEEVK